MSIEQEFKYRFIVDANGNPKKVPLHVYNEMKEREALLERSDDVEYKLFVKIALSKWTWATIAAASAIGCLAVIF